MKKTTKTTAIAILIVSFFGLAACQEEVIPTIQDIDIEVLEIQDSIESENKEGDEDEGEDIRG